MNDVERLKLVDDVPQPWVVCPLKKEILVSRAIMSEGRVLLVGNEDGMNVACDCGPGPQEQERSALSLMRAFGSKTFPVCGQLPETVVTLQSSAE